MMHVYYNDYDFYDPTAKITWCRDAVASAPPGLHFIRKKAFLFFLRCIGMLLTKTGESLRESDWNGIGQWKGERNGRKGREKGEKGKGKGVPSHFLQRTGCTIWGRVLDAVWQGAAKGAVYFCAGFFLSVEASYRLSFLLDRVNAQ